MFNKNKVEKWKIHKASKSFFQAIYTLLILQQFSLNMNLPIKKKKKKKKNICLTIFRQHFVLVKLEIPSSCTYQPNAANQYLGNKSDEYCFWIMESVWWWTITTFYLTLFNITTKLKNKYEMNFEMVLEHTNFNYI